MGGDGQTTVQVGAGGSLHQLAVDLDERAGVHPDLDEARPEASAVDAVLPLAQPACGQLIRTLGLGVGRQVLSLPGAVVAGVGEDLETAGLGQALEQGGIGAQLGRGALDQRLAAQFLDAFQMGQGHPEDLVGVIAVPIDLVGADEIDQDVFVGQRDAKFLGCDRPLHCDHLSWLILARPQAAASGQTDQGRDGL